MDYGVPKMKPENEMFDVICDVHFLITFLTMVGSSLGSFGTLGAFLALERDFMKLLCF